MDQFNDLGAVVVQSQLTHWTHKPGATPLLMLAVLTIRYTLAADINHAICQAYGVESDGGLSATQLVQRCVPHS